LSIDPDPLCSRAAMQAIAALEAWSPGTDHQADIFANQAFTGVCANFINAGPGR
jgi:hypothetical protein